MPPAAAAQHDNLQPWLALAAQPVLVVACSAPCGPCEQFKLFLPKLAIELGDALPPQPIDIADHAGFAAQHAIGATPTLVLFHRGAGLDRRQGFTIGDYRDFHQWLLQALHSCGLALAPDAREAGFTAAKAAFHAAVDPLLYAAVAAQAPHLPGFQAQQIDAAAHAAGRQAAADALRTATGAARAQMEAAMEAAEPVLLTAIEAATAGYAAADRATVAASCGSGP